MLLIAILPLTRVPSRAVAIAAGIFAGGVLGNLLSASTDGLYVPNPIIIMHGMGGVAFNPADTFILAGNLALMIGAHCGLRPLSQATGSVALGAARGAPRTPAVARLKLLAVQPQLGAKLVDAAMKLLPLG